MAVVESALGAVSKIGPYFTSISLIPAAGLTFTVYLLGRAEPWTGHPNWHQVLDVSGDLSLSGALIGMVVTVILAMVLHPLQFAAVQTLEGYWGPNPAALRAADIRISHYAQRFTDLAKRRQKALSNLPRSMSGPPTSTQLQWIWRRQEATRALAEFPDEKYDLMPTRLGNILRRYERRAGQPYGIDVVVVATHLGLLAPKEHLDYLQDQRTQLDLAVRLTLTSAILTVITTLMFAPSGWWALLGLLPCLAAMAFYRGACVVAHHYGNALQTIVDLNRRQIYDRLDLPMPRSLAEERKQNENLDLMLRRKGQVNMTQKGRTLPGGL